MKSSLQYQPQESDYSFGLNFTAMHTNVSFFFQAQNAYSSNTLTVGVFTEFLNLKNWSIGLRILGWGVTHENCSINFLLSKNRRKDLPLSSTDCFCRAKIYRRGLSIILSLNALWFDPIGSFYARSMGAGPVRGRK